MSTIRIKRGLAANAGNVTPLIGEPIYLTDTKKLMFGDGSTAGGLDLAYVGTEAVGVANGVASLDAGGLIPNAQLPALAITDVNTAANETEQLALTAQEGDVCVRTDESKSYIHNGGTAGTMADWQEMISPTDSVTSVNGQTGVVSLSTTDISEGTNLYYTDVRTDARIAAASIDALTDVDTTTTAPTNGQVMSWDGTNWVPADSATSTYTAGTGLALTGSEFTLDSGINGLTDVDTTTTAPADGDVMAWDATNSKWVPAEIDGGTF
jgi:hypothetical protein